MSRLVAKYDLFSTSLPILTVTSVRHKGGKYKPEKGKAVWQYLNLPDPETEAGKEFEKGEYAPRRIAYWPPDIKGFKPRGTLLQRKPWWPIKEYITLVPPDDIPKPEYTDKPQYPQIMDYEVGNRNDIGRHQRLKWYESIRKLPTAIEKALAITEVYRHPCVMLKSYMYMYDQLNVYQNVTKTKIVEGRLPKIYDDINVSSLTDQVSQSIMDAVVFNREECPASKRSIGRWRNHDGQVKSLQPELNSSRSALLDVINIVVKACSDSANHLVNAQVDFAPSVRSFWFGGNMELPGGHPKFTARRQLESNQPFQFYDEGVMHIRSANYLPPSIDRPSDDDTRNSLEHQKLNPGRIGYPMKHYRFASLPGFLPWIENDLQDFPFLSVYDSNNVVLRKYLSNMKIDFPDTEDCFDGMAIMYNFAWLNSLALYHGFTPYDELTYPFTTQAIVSDGKTWNFYVYELHSHAFHGDLQKDGLSNGLYNLCWKSGPMKLYEEVTENGIVDFNDKVVELLLKFASLRPQPVPESLHLKPYLSEVSVDPEVMKERQFRLMRYFGQWKTYQETYIMQKARPRPWDFAYGHRNPDAPPIVHWRKPSRFEQYRRFPKDKFTV